jgi:hypothetical protein
METTMTVIIHAPNPDPVEVARLTVDNALADRAKHAASQHYDSEMRQRAIDAIVDYLPAYLRLSDYSDDLGTLACMWSMGSTSAATPNLDPSTELRGLRQVAKHIMALWPMAGREKIIKVLRNLQPLNAVAMIDRQMLTEELGLEDEDIDWSPEAARRRAAAYKLHAAMTMVSGKGA